MFCYHIFGLPLFSVLNILWGFSFGFFFNGSFQDNFILLPVLVKTLVCKVRFVFIFFFCDLPLWRLLDSEGKEPLL